MICDNYYSILSDYEATTASMADRSLSCGEMEEQTVGIPIASLPLTPKAYHDSGYDSGSMPLRQAVEANVEADVEAAVQASVESK